MPPANPPSPSPPPPPEDCVSFDMLIDDEVGVTPSGELESHSSSALVGSTASAQSLVAGEPLPSENVLDAKGGIFYAKGAIFGEISREWPLARTSLFMMF